MSKIKKEDMFKLLYEKTNTGIAVNEIILDDNGNPVDYIFLDVNSAYEKLTNLKLKDIKGKKGTELFPDLDKKWIEMYGKVALSGKTISAIYNSHIKNRYWEVSAYSLGKKMFAVALKDATSRELAKRDLIATKELAEKYLEMTGSIFVALNPQGNILVLNRKGQEILGYSQSEIIGKNWFDICIPEQNIEEIKSVFKKVFNGDMKGAEHHENEVVTKSGEKRIISWYNSYIKNENDETEYLLSSGVDVTEINKTKQDLEAIWNVSPDLICVADIKTATFLKINPSFIKTLGFSEAELLGKSFLEYIHPDDVQTTIDVVEKKLKKNIIVVNFMNRYRCKDGSFRYLDWVSRPIIEQGVAYAIARDVTEKIKIEQKLRDSERLLNETGKMARIGGWELDVKSQKISWSEEIYHIHQIPFDEEPPLQDAINFYHPEDRPILQKALQNAIAKGESFNLELRFKTAKGKELFTHTQCKAQMENGKVVKLLGTFQDITEEKKYKIEIEERTKFIQTVLDKLPIGIATNDIESGKTKYVNEKFTEIYGWSAADLKTVNDFFKKVFPDEKKRNQIQEIISADMNSGDINRMHWENLNITRRDGTQRIVNAVNIPIFEQNTMISTVTDITKLKEYEMELEKYKENLEEMVEIRTKNLKAKNDELQEFNQLFVRRELRIKELKDKVIELQDKIKYLKSSKI